MPQIRLGKPPVEEADLVGAALAEIGRGATWVKVIADFGNLAAWTGTRGITTARGPRHWARMEGRSGVLVGG